MNKKKLVLVALCAYAFSACAISVKVPINRLESPEAIGRPMGVKLEGIAKENADVVLTDDYTYRGPDTRNPDITHTRDVAIGAGIGITDRFELAFRSGSHAYAKYQIFGDSVAKAKAGNFSLTALGGVGFDADAGSSDSSILSSAAKYTLTSVSYDLALILGIRAADMLLFYGGPSFTRYIYEGERGVSNGSMNGFSGSIEQRGAHFGIEVRGGIALVKAELGYGITTAHEAKKDQALVGVGLTILIPESDNKPQPQKAVN